MEFLNEYHLAGLFIGICTFLIIGLFHPVVVKAEYYWGTKCWWIFLILGIGGVIASLSIDNVILSSLLGARRSPPAKAQNPPAAFFSSRPSLCLFLIGKKV